MPTQTMYHIERMTRWSSAEAVADRLSALPHVQEVHMDIVAGTALITSDDTVPLEEVHAAVAEAGHVLVTSPRGLQDGSKVGLSIFIGGLVAALIAGFALAKVITPAEAAPTAEPAPSPNAHLHGQTGDVGGLSISSAGYTLEPKASVSGLSFVIKDAQGKAVTRFATVHEKLMHVVLVRRDLTGYQHLHPVMTPDGVWTVTTTLAESGPWRVFADFTVINASYAQIPVTLGYDLLVGGAFQPRSLPAPARESIAGSTTVTYEGTPLVGAMVPLLFRVFANGSPVTDLQPYLGSFGHLVVLRDGDLGYIHVHPEPQLSGGAVKVWLMAPNPGVYRMFFDFQTHGQVRTAEYTLSVGSV